jgi:transposase InsO family protein
MRGWIYGAPSTLRNFFFTTANTPPFCGAAPTAIFFCAIRRCQNRGLARRCGGEERGAYLRTAFSRHQRIRGSIGYYGRFYKDQLRPNLKRIDAYVFRWARRKFKRKFTSDAFTDGLIENGIAISMDGKGSWRDNVFMERFWRTVKYEEVYLKAYESVAEARSSIGCYLRFYDSRRPHSALDRHTPDQAYYASLPRCA